MDHQLQQKTGIGKACQLIDLVRITGLVRLEHGFRSIAVPVDRMSCAANKSCTAAPINSRLEESFIITACDVEGIVKLHEWEDESAQTRSYC